MPSKDAQRAGKIRWELRRGGQVSTARRKWLDEWDAGAAARLQKRKRRAPPPTPGPVAKSGTLAEIAGEAFDLPTNFGENASAAQCSACKADLHDGDRHCPRCGSLARTDLCNACDEPLRDGKFCRQCGEPAPAPPAAESEVGEASRSLLPASRSSAPEIVPWWTARKCELVIVACNKLLVAKGMDELDGEESKEITEALADVLNKHFQPAGAWAEEFRLGAAVFFAFWPRWYVKYVIEARKAREAAVIDGVAA